MKNAFNLSIKTPCQENFHGFSQTEKGGFCGSCQKEVIDFTNMKQDEIISYFKQKETQNVCGRFKNTQLKTYNTQQKKQKRLSFISGIGLACLALFSFGTTQAQETNTSEDTSKNHQQLSSNILVKGTVTENNQPLPAVNIILEGTTIGTQTDFDGNFTFPQKLKKGDILVFSHIGKKSQKVVITDENSTSKIELAIDMQHDEVIMMGKVATKEVYKSKKK